MFITPVRLSIARVGMFNTLRNSYIVGQLRYMLMDVTLDVIPAEPASQRCFCFFLMVDSDNPSAYPEKSRASLHTFAPLSHLHLRVKLANENAKIGNHRIHQNQAFYILPPPSFSWKSV